LVYGVELRIEKRRGRVPDRHTAVLLADLDGYSVHEVFVAEDGSVVEAVERPHLLPPFSEEELAEATVLARGHPEVAGAIRWGVRPAAFYPSRHHGEAAGQEPYLPRRRVGIHYLDFSDPAAVVPVVSVVVDLTGRAVESVEHHRAGA
jgi:hypothetical protein